MSTYQSHNPSLAHETERDGEILDGEYIRNTDEDENFDMDNNLYGQMEGEELEDDEMNQEGEEHSDMDDYENQEQEEEFDDMNMNQIHKTPKPDDLSKVSEQKEEIDDQEEFDFLPPERKVRFRVIRFINRLREKYNLLPFYNDLVGNKVAMAYAKHLLKEKENEAEFVKYSKVFGFVGTYKISNFSVFIDVSNDDGGKKNKYSGFIEEFLDAQSTLVEFEQHKNNFLSNAFNTVSFGCAFDEEKVVVVDIFNTRTLMVEEVKINTENGSVVIMGKMLNLKYGVFALRIVNEDALNKEIIKINVQNISYNRQTNVFKATFNKIGNLLEDKSNKLIEIYLREKPETIVYEVAFEGFKVDDLTLGIRVPLEHFPQTQIIKENDQELQNEIRRQNDEEKKKNDERQLEREENQRRKKAATEIKNGELGKIQEVADEEANLDDPKNDNDSKKNENLPNTNLSKHKIVNEVDPSVMFEPEIEDIAGYNKKNYEQQLDDLEKNIEQLKRENEDLQRKISYIYDFSKNDKEDRNFYKDTNINDSTYNDSLNSAANLYNELNTHRKKLAADEKRYHASIRVQEDRKRDVYDILMKYKEELIMNAEYSRKGSKIPDETRRDWLDTEKEYEDKIKAKRIENYKYSYELQRKTKELKKMEEYFEGLHLIDFEQLKIENNTLTEKIEDRNEEIHKLNNKINSNVQILAHLQEKLRFVENECSSLADVEGELKKKLDNYKADLSSNKDNIEKNTIKNLMEKKKVDSINSENLLNYYNSTNKNIDFVTKEIHRIFNELEKYRKNQAKGMSDVKILKIRGVELAKEYEDLKNNKF